MIAAVVAADLNWGIGRKGELLTHIPNDLKHFKSLTENNTVIMGRKTWDSLPKKPLPNRKNIIISNTLDLHNENVECLNLEKGKEYIKQFIDTNEKCFVIGGGIIYKEFFSFCQ